MKKLCGCLPVLICLAGCSTNPATPPPLSSSLNEHPRVIQCKKVVDLIRAGIIREGMTQDQVRQLMGNPHNINASHWHWVGRHSQPPAVQFNDGEVIWVTSGSHSGCLQAGT